MSARLSTVVVDCRDEVSLSRFWCDVLGWQVIGQDDDGAIEIGPDDGSRATTLLFEPVPEPKTIKNRLHLDVNPMGVDQDDELARLLALGARQIDIGQGDQTWFVLADPEGNEFCLLRSRVD